MDDDDIIGWQCDQMAKLIVQYLAMYNNECLPNSMKKTCQSRIKFLPNTK